MIVYLVTEAGDHTFSRDLPRCLPGFRRAFRVLTYERLARRRSLPAATYIFADIDRLPPPLAERAARIWQALAAAGPRVRLLNHPLHGPLRTAAHAR